MTAPLATFAGVLGLLLGPLALAGPTAWLLIPVHAVLSGAVCVGSAWDGWRGHTGRARMWGFGYLLATLWMVVGLDIGAAPAGGSLWYWGPPWIAVATWAWIPPVVAGVAGQVAELRSMRMSRRAVMQRRKDRAQTAETQRTQRERRG